jgi:hypothetical protein
MAAASALPPRSPLDSVAAALNTPTTASPTGQWLLASGQNVPHGPTQQQWLASLRAATAGRWRAGSASDVPERPALASVQAEGQALGTLWIEPSSGGSRVVWRDAAGAVWIGSLPPTSTLVQQLSAW